METSNIILNISGTKYEISSTTFIRMTLIDSDAKLTLEKMKGHLSQDKCDYFLERNPNVFPAVLSYFQGNGLHVPALTCIAEFKNELDFWGICPKEIEHCCYSKYVCFYDDQNALKILTDDQSQRNKQRAELQQRISANGWIAIQARVWSVLEEPSFNFLAKVGVLIYSLVFWLLKQINQQVLYKVDRQLVIISLVFFYGVCFEMLVHVCF